MIRGTVVRAAVAVFAVAAIGVLSCHMVAWSRCSSLSSAPRTARHQPAATPERNWTARAQRVTAKRDAIAERGPKRFDQPQEAMDFFLQQRLRPGQNVLPLEKLRQAEASVRARQQALAGAAAGAGPSLPTWTEIGPGNIGGRTRALVINPDQPDVMYAAGVAGGVWKTTDGGASWAAADDFLLNLAVVSLVMDPTDPNTLYAGTGEGFFNGDAVRGLGIFKTTDAGNTWNQLLGTVTGVPEGSFYRVNALGISPTDPDRVYACTRYGVWRSADAGATWDVVLQNPTHLASPGIPQSNGSFVGCSDLALRQDTLPGADVLFAAFGSFGPDGLFRSTDGGNTWLQLGTTSDVAAANQGRMELAIAPADNDIIYVSMADNGDTGRSTGTMVNVFRSLDGGNTWSGRLNFANPISAFLLSNLVFGNGCFGTFNLAQGWYDNVIAVDPLDPDRVWVGGIDLFRSDDGGANFGIASYWYFDRNDPNYVHADHHALVFHPGYNGTTNQVLYSGSDGGVARTDNARADTSIEGCPFPADDPLPAIAWTQLNNNYGTVQFYHGDSAKDRPLFGGGTQDNGTLQVDSASTPNDWFAIFGGDGGYHFIHPLNSLTMYVETQGFPQIRKSVDGGQTFVSATNGITDTDGLFITPYALDQRFPNTLWTGGTRPWRTTDAAASWTLAGPNFPQATQLSAVAVAPTDSRVVYLGFANGAVARTTNALPGVPEWEEFGAANGLPSLAFISSIAISPVDPDTAYCTSSTFDVPHVLRTNDGGQTWVSLDGPEATGVPDIPVHWIAIRPCDPQELYLGTELGVFMSPDDGGTWLPSNSGLANTVVESLDFQDADTLVAFTHGRGAFRAQLSPACNGACCVGPDCEEDLLERECIDLGGVYHAGRSCTAVSCVGACCREELASCTENVTVAECVDGGGTRYTDGGGCADFDPPCGAAACCRVDDAGTPDDPTDDLSFCADLTRADCLDAGGDPSTNTLCADTGFSCPSPVCTDGQGDCLDPHGGPGCELPSCCNAVCSQDPSCCQDGWDQVCAGLAAEICALNDDCSNAISIGEGLTPFSTIGATTDGPPDCLNGDPNVGTNDIWYVYEATCDGDADIRLCGAAEYDNTLQMYEGVSCDPLGTQLDCDDDSCARVGGPARLLVPVVAGRRYLLRVGGWGGDAGSGEISVACLSTVPDPLRPDPDGVAKNRAVSFQSLPFSIDGGRTAAIRLRIQRMYVGDDEDPQTGCPSRPASLSDLSQFEGDIRWLGPPERFSEDTATEMPDFIASPLQCCPHFRDWGKAALLGEFGFNVTVGIIHAFGREIVPCSTYELTQIDTSCAATLDEECFSDPLVLRTNRWGDVWAPFGGTTQPNVTDVVKIMDKFRGIAYVPGPPEAGAPPKTRAMLRGNSPPFDTMINVIDVSRAVDAFRGIGYAEPGPLPDQCALPCE